MNFRTPYLNWMEPELNRYLYSAHGPRAYLNTAFSFPYLALFSQPSDSSLWSEPYSSKGAVSPLETITDGFVPKTLHDPLEPFFTARGQFWAKSVDDILGLISERERLKYENMHKIDYESCQIKTRLFELDHWRRGFDPRLERTRVQIERELSALEREKRFEEVACWRDVTRLRSELREAVREYGLEKRKQALLTER